MITLPMLLSDIKPSILSLSGVQKTYREYRGIYLIDSLNATEENMVYVGTCDAVSRLLVRGELADNCLIFSAGTSISLQNAPARGVTLVITSLSLTALYNQLTKSFLQYEDWQHLLLAESKKGMRALLSAASHHFGLSVILTTGDLRPLARSIREDDSAVISADSISSPVLTQLLEKLEQSREYTAAVTRRKNGYVHALVPIHRQNTILGYLFACSNGGSSILQNILYVMAQTIAQLMTNDEWNIRESDSFQALAAQLFGDTPENMDKLEDCLKHLPNKPKRFMRGIIIRIILEDGNDIPVYPQKLRQLYQEVCLLFPLDNTALLDECIYVMTSDDKPDSPITVTENSVFEALLEKHGAYAMVSNPSQRLQGVRVLFRQCFQILPAAVSVRYEEESGHRCLRFDRYSPYYIIRLCEQSVRHELGINDILYLCHPAVLTLTRYDRAYNNNLRDTLFTFLMNDRSISETSRKLFMHRNTTIYKLNKIQELIHDTLDNPYTRHQLILSCMIIRYVEQYQHAPFNLPPLESSLLRK